MQQRYIYDSIPSDKCKVSDKQVVTETVALTSSKLVSEAGVCAVLVSISLPAGGSESCLSTPTSDRGAFKQLYSSGCL